MTKKNNNRNRTRKRKTGFTLVELLVAMAILGIIIGISLPLIRNVQGNQTKQKYDTYHNSVEQSARIYVDNYGKDEFGNEEEGCIIIKLQELIELDLAKDIQIDEKSCNSDDSFVKVVKNGNRYTYTTYLSCGTPNASGKVLSDAYDDSMNDGVKFTTEDDNCNLEIKEKVPMKLTATPAEYKKLDMKRVSSVIKIDNSENNTGINKSSRISYVYSKSETPPTKGWNNLNLKISGDIVTSTAITPENTTAKYYLYLNTKNLLDSKGAKADIVLAPSEDSDKLLCKYANASNKNIIKCGIYVADNEKPEFNNTKPVPGGSFSTTKLFFDATDTFTTDASLGGSKELLRLCLELNKGTEKCPAVPNEKYKTFGELKDGNSNNAKLDSFLTGTDKTEGVTKANLYIADQAGNVNKTSYSIYKITYDSNKANLCSNVSTGGEQCNSAFKYGFGGGEWGELCAPSRAYYDFGGWYSKSDLSGNQVQANTTVEGNKKVYAKWNPIKYSITYEYYIPTYQKSIAASEIGNKNNPASYTIETKTFTLTKPTKAGYTFEGWTGPNGTTPDKTVSVSQCSHDNKTYRANFTPNNYTITLNKNGGTKDGTTSISAAYDSTTLSPSSISLPERKYTVSYDGNGGSPGKSSDVATYTVSGWYSKASGGSKVLSGGTSPALQENVSGYTGAGGVWKREGGATLYADWDSGSVTLPTATRGTGFTFRGWYNGSTKVGDAGDSYTPTKNVTLTAKWQYTETITINKEVCRSNSYSGSVSLSHGVESIVSITSSNGVTGSGTPTGGSTISVSLSGSTDKRKVEEYNYGPETPVVSSVNDHCKKCKYPDANKELNPTNGICPELDYNEGTGSGWVDLKCHIDTHKWYGKAYPGTANVTCTGTTKYWYYSGGPDCRGNYGTSLNDAYDTLCFRLKEGEYCGEDASATDTQTFPTVGYCHYPASAADCSCPTGTTKVSGNCYSCSESDETLDTSESPPVCRHEPRLTDEYYCYKFGTITVTYVVD